MPSNGMNTFSATECITFGWETFKKRPWFLIGTILLYVVVVWVISFALGELTRVGPVGAIIATVANWTIGILAGMGLLSFMLKAHDNVAQAALADFWNPHMFWQYLAASILMGLAIVAGLILLIVPGVIIALMFSLAPYLVIEHKMGPIVALKESARMTKGYKWQLFLLALLTILISILGLLALIVGLLVASPVIALAQVHAYRLLSAKADAIVPTTPAAHVVS